MNITYDYYRVFYYVARCGSFAARRAGAAEQPAQRIKSHPEP